MVVGGLMMISAMSHLWFLALVRRTHHKQQSKAAKLTFGGRHIGALEAKVVG